VAVPFGVADSGTAAARINEALGLGGESVATVELLLDKWRMRQQLAARGISPVASAVGRSTQDVREFVAAHGFPIIVRPIRESGSLAVFCIRDRADVDVVAEQFRSLDDGHWAAGDLFRADSFDEFLMDEFLDGPEISVETLSFDAPFNPYWIEEPTSPDDVLAHRAIAWCSSNCYRPGGRARRVGSARAHWTRP
jgi:biotin carboxylase